MTATALNPTAGTGARGLLGCRRSGVRPALWAELLVVVALCWAYDAVNSLAPIRAGAAMDHARDVLDLERLVHADPERSLDHWFSAHHTLASIFANYYDNAHFVVTFTVVGLMWLLGPAHYRPLRNGLILVNLVAMAVFWLFPTAPPRLLDPAHFPDLVAATHAFGSWHSGTLSHAANQFAAMPSLHIGWACWVAIAVRRCLRSHRWSLLAWLYPGLTAVAVMATGNHFLLDVVAGAVAMGLVMLVADRWDRWRTTRQARRVIRRSREGRPERTALRYP